MRTQQPALRITRWLKKSKVPGREVPIEAECSACSNAQFVLRHDVREKFHEPDRDVYMANLQSQFEAHLRVAHKDEIVPRKP